MPPTTPRTAPAAMTLISAAFTGVAAASAASSSPMRAAADMVSGVADVAGQHAGADADLLHRPVVLGFDVHAEDQLRIGAAMQPAVLLHLVLELARRPAGITEREDGAGRPGAAGDRLEDVERRGEADALIDGE